jgi:hypothetical protein
MTEVNKFKNLLPYPPSQDGLRFMQDMTDHYFIQANIPKAPYNPVFRVGAPYYQGNKPGVVDIDKLSGGGEGGPTGILAPILSNTGLIEDPNMSFLNLGLGLVEDPNASDNKKDELVADVLEPKEDVVMAAEDAEEELRRHILPVQRQITDEELIQVYYRYVHADKNPAEQAKITEDFIASGGTRADIARMERVVAQAGERERIEAGRIEAGRMQDEKHDFDDASIEAEAAELRRLAEDKKQQVETNILTRNQHKLVGLAPGVSQYTDEQLSNIYNEYKKALNSRTYKASTIKLLKDAGLRQGDIDRMFILAHKRDNRHPFPAL